MGFESTALRDIDLVGCSNNWATRDSVVTNGQIVVLQWNRIAQLHSQRTWLIWTHCIGFFRVYVSPRILVDVVASLQYIELLHSICQWGFQFAGFLNQVIIVWLLYVCYLIRKEWFTWLQANFIYKILYAGERQSSTNKRNGWIFDCVSISLGYWCQKKRENRSFRKRIFKLLAVPSA